MDNVMSGQAGNVVQAASVGEIHFHGVELPKPHQLPSAIDRLVNQKRVLGELDEALALRGDKPVIRVLRGQRGSGKSTVAVKWLDDTREQFPDGQLYADLGAWTDEAEAPSEVLAEFIAALGLGRDQIPAGLGARSGLFKSMTDGRSFQVLLDDAVTPAQVRPLLPGRGGSMVLVTGHGAFAALHQENARQLDIAPLEPEMAVELLRTIIGDRADEPGRDVLVEKCAGLPAALCVAGLVLAESQGMSVRDLLDELDEVGITGMTVGGEPSLGQVFGVGYERLSTESQRWYRVIGLHPRWEDVPLAALGADRRALRELEVMRIVEFPRSGRLTVNKLVHEHARRVAEAVDPPEVRAAVRRMMLRWYEARAVAADESLVGARPWRKRYFPESLVDEPFAAKDVAAQWMRDERLNLRAAVKLAADLDEPRTVLRLCVTQWWLLESEKYADDVLATHPLGITAAEHLELPDLKALLLVQQGFAMRFRYRPAEARELFEQAAGVAVDPELKATAVEGAGLAAFDAGNEAEAQRLLRHNLELAEDIKDPRRRALACLHLAKVEEADRALELLERAKAEFESSEPVNFAKVLLWQGRKSGRRELLLEALAIMTELDRQLDRAEILVALGEYRQALEIYTERGQIWAAKALQERLD
ncbi:hypothetical protein Lesp02_41390 [Lentzea sp. NBRC 105346]|uniref:NB-ARC domain-containing protein n=1 Tax=Lentzea sp. NBRC 105346 TaxID=3032205 RepID=UPI0024A2F78C|nr:NB-ARC domain-containing protein [Lentzea sp. NBRC 105346]GLZ31951.1 hypothetical protein Lesp02_41390 [Lentzea sp. NBRC 105346]